MIILGRARDYEIAPAYVERSADQLGVPALHLWVLAEDGDPPGAMEGGLAAALDELFVLATEVSVQLQRAVERLPSEAPDWKEHTADEIELARRFCEIVHVRGVGLREFMKVRFLDDQELGVFHDNVFVFQKTRH